MRESFVSGTLLEPILHRKHKWAFARSFLGFLQLVFKSRYSSSLILSACCGTEVKAALKGLQSPNVPVWGERWDHGCDTWVWFEYLPPPPEQWSIISVCQPPLPAGDSITSILGVFLLFLSLSLFCCLLIFFLAISWSISNLPFISRLLCGMLLMYSVLPLMPLFMSPPVFFFSHHHTRFSCSFYLSCCPLAWRYHTHSQKIKENKGRVVRDRWKWMRDTRHDWRRAQNLNLAAKCTSARIIYRLF